MQYLNDKISHNIKYPIVKSQKIETKIIGNKALIKRYEQIINDTKLIEDTNIPKNNILYFLKNIIYIKSDIISIHIIINPLKM